MFAVAMWKKRAQEQGAAVEMAGETAESANVSAREFDLWSSFPCHSARTPMAARFQDHSVPVCEVSRRDFGQARANF
jgi:hypothetical protein